MSHFEHLICPVCQRPLLQNSKSLICLAGHNFDIAGKSYVNLLLSRDKNSKDPGDNKEMAKARKRFLDRGYYESLSRGLSEVLIKNASIKEAGTFKSAASKSVALNGAASKNGPVILDAGCGDGYYTDYIQRTIKDKLPGSSCVLYGMDISKEAIRLASGRNKEIGFIVASLFKLPFKSNQADYVINAFAPACDPEFGRVLKKGGTLITVIPGRKHLFELKSVLYENPYENDEKGPDLPSFRSEGQVRIKSVIKIDSAADLSDLLTMTPYYWRTPKEGIDRFRKLKSLETTTEFVIGIHSKL